MNRSLYFKIILILVIFIITIMVIVGVSLMNSVFSFYNDDFISQMETAFAENGELVGAMRAAMGTQNSYSKLGELLKANSGVVGIDNNRSYYVLDMLGNPMVTSASDADDMSMTPNIVSALNTKDVSYKLFPDKEKGASYSDCALYLSENGDNCVIYIKESQEEAHSFSMVLFTVVIQTVLIGLLISVALSFFLARTITAPIQSLTVGAQRIANGEFTHELNVHSEDEIGILTDTFNNMKDVLRNTMDEISGERKKFESLFMYLNDAIIAFDEFGRMLHINKRARAMFLGDFDNNDVVMSVHLTFSKMVKLLNIDYREASEKFKSDRNFSVHDISYNNQTFDINFVDFKYTDSGEKNGIMCVIHDTTERSELDRSRREFVADVSHELRTPITSIRNAVETVMEYPDMDKEFKDNFLQMAIDECDRMTRIVSDLLILSRLDNQRTTWQIETFDMSTLVKKVCEVMAGSVKEHKHRLECRPGENIPPVTADKEKIQQVLVNIVSNSVKYTPDGGIIVVQCVGESDGVTISVTDNGIGVPEKDIPRLFERFYRVEKSRTSDTGGTGLGLAIAKEIVDAHGGTIVVRSKLNVGTVVAIKLPYQTLIKT